MRLRLHTCTCLSVRERTREYEHVSVKVSVRACPCTFTDACVCNSARAQMRLGLYVCVYALIRACVQQFVQCTLPDGIDAGMYPQAERDLISLTAFFDTGTKLKCRERLPFFRLRSKQEIGQPGSAGTKPVADGAQLQVSVTFIAFALNHAVT